MATNTDRIAELEKTVTAMNAWIPLTFEVQRKEMDRHASQIDKIQGTCNEILVRLAAIDQRLASVEKYLDEIRTRRWQIYVLVLGWLFSTILGVLAFVMRR
jgi:hypothetical protein